MADGSKIEWCDATWSPVVGCSVISAGCTNCYAMRMAARLERMGSAKYAGLTQPSKAGPVWTGTVRLDRNALSLPLRWRKARRIFVNPMADLFHEGLSDADIDQVFAVMQRCTRHTFQILTKRSERMRDYVTALYAEADANNRRWFDRGFVWPLGTKAAMAKERVVPFSNVWLGASVEDQARADERIPDLLATPAALRFVSAEPLLEEVTIFSMDGPVDVPDGMTSPLHWVICGGESGPGARPMELAWIRSLREQCKAVGVPFFAKQLGSATGFNLHDRKGGDWWEWPSDLRVREFPQVRHG